VATDAGRVCQAFAKVKWLISLVIFDGDCTTETLRTRSSYEEEAFLATDWHRLSQGRLILFGNQTQ
jgi:hypothetical protein